MTVNAVVIRQLYNTLIPSVLQLVSPVYIYDVMCHAALLPGTHELAFQNLGKFLGTRIHLAFGVIAQAKI